MVASEQARRYNLSTDGGAGAATGTEHPMTYSFSSRSDAWAFMRACDEAGVSAGFPNYATDTCYHVSVSSMVPDIAKKFGGR